MLSNRLSIDEIENVIESEELGYAVQHYLPPEKIADEYLRAMWQEARTMLNDIERYIRYHSDPEKAGEELWMRFESPVGTPDDTDAEDSDDD